MNKSLEQIDIAIKTTEELCFWTDTQLTAVIRNHSSLEKIINDLDQRDSPEAEAAIESLMPLWHEANTHLIGVRNRLYFYNQKLEGMKVIRKRMLQIINTPLLENKGVSE